MTGSSGFDQMIPIQGGNNIKKRVAILLAVALTLALAACKKPVEVNWSRTGQFEDADGNYLTVAASEDEENPGWMVWCMLGEETHGWYIQQEGEALQGNLTSEFEDAEDFIVTITEEGEDGLQMAVEGGEIYHFTPLAEMPSLHVSVDTVGLGRVYYAEAGEALVFDEESPSQVIRFNLSDAGSCQFGARADEGWQFVKWIMNGEDFSADEEIAVEITESKSLVAVFEPIG